MMLEQREMVLIPIPFTDLSSQRRRPVVVISNNDYNSKTQDIVVVAMTSNLQETDYSFIVTNENMKSGVLREVSRVRCDKIYTLSQSIVVRRLAKINEQTFDQILQTLQRVTEKL